MMISSLHADRTGIQHGLPDKPDKPGKLSLSGNIGLLSLLRYVQSVLTEHPSNDILISETVCQTGGFLFMRAQRNDQYYHDDVWAVRIAGLTFCLQSVMIMTEMPKGDAL